MDGLTITHDVIYKSGVVTDGEQVGSGLNLKMDILSHSDRSKKLPCVISIPGGGFMISPKSVTDPDLVYIAQSGYVVVSIEYHVIGQGLFMDALTDVKAAVRYLRANAAEYGIDPNWIALYGGSAGGYMASMSGITNEEKDLICGDNTEYSSEVQAFIDKSGPSDLTKIADDFDQEKQEKTYKNPKQGEAQFVHGIDSNLSIADHTEAFHRANPLNYVNSSSPPALFFHGDQDTVISPSQTLILHNAMREKGVESTRYSVVGAGHFSSDFISKPAMEITVAFLNRHLKG